MTTTTWQVWCAFVMHNGREGKKCGECGECVECGGHEGKQNLLGELCLRTALFDPLALRLPFLRVQLCASVQRGRCAYASMRRKWSWQWRRWEAEAVARAVLADKTGGMFPCRGVPKCSSTSAGTTTATTVTTVAIATTVTIVTAVAIVTTAVEVAVCGGTRCVGHRVPWGTSTCGIPAIFRLRSSDIAERRAARKCFACSVLSYAARSTGSHSVAFATWSWWKRAAAQGAVR